MKRILAMLLACVMVVSLAACGGPEPTQPTTQPTTAPTTVPTTAPTTEPTTEPVIQDPTTLYSQAAAALQAGTDYILTISTKRTLTINGETFVDASAQTVTFSGYGTDDLRAYLTETVDQDGYVSKYVEYFRNGTLYTIVDEAGYFKGELSAGEYMDRMAPLVMLDAALYEEVTLNGSTISFRVPSSGETWIVPEYAELEDSSGFALLDDNGSITASSYEVTYTIGGNEIHYVVDMTIQPAGNTTPDAVEDPENYIQLEYVDAPRMLNNAAGYLWQAYEGHSLTTTMAESVFSQAGGVIRNQTTTINSWGSGKDYTAESEISVFQMTMRGESSQEQVERFENDTYTVSVDDAEPRKNSMVKADDFKSYVVQTMLSNMPEASLLTSATAEDLGSLYYLELSFGEDMPQNICKYICKMFWNDENFLNELASKYQTVTMDYYLAMDKYTGLPTAVGYNYEGSHTIEGYGYPLTMQLDQSFTLYSTDAYRTLTDKVQVPEEPEEKATPLFYHVTGSNGEEMWLLGTIHVGDERTSYLPQEIYAAFDAADALAVEFNSEAFNDAMENDEELSSQVSDCYFYSDGSTTQEHIKDQELFEYAEKLLKAIGGYHMNMPYAKPYLWSSSIDNFMLAQFNSLSSQQGVDNQLIWRAEDQNKPIYDVESGLFQTQMLTGFSDPLQEMLLLESAGIDPVEYVAGTQELFEMWCAGDEDALSAYLNEEGDLSELTDEELALLEEYNNAMGADRNDDMLDVAIDYLESGEVVFYAVGLAHLLAEDGLVHTLRDAGYTVELVTFE